MFLIKIHDSPRIHYVRNMDEIRPEFIINKSTVDYEYKNKFSPVHLVKQIHLDLSEIDIAKSKLCER